MEMYLEDVFISYEQRLLSWVVRNNIVLTVIDIQGDVSTTNV